MNILLVFLLVSTATAAIYRRPPAKRSEWGYGDTNGPDTWPIDFPTCGGSRQSPVSLVTNNAQVYLPAKPFEFDNYDEVPKLMTLSNTGHSVQVNSGVDASVTNGILLDDYVFYQFHFHWGAEDSRGSEHTIDYARFPGELHLVHYRKSYGTWEEALEHSDGVIVIGVMLDLAFEDNPYLQPIVNNLQHIIEPHQVAIIEPFALQDLLPYNVNDYFAYQGSLTTPSCKEVVTWVVFRDRIPISSNQLKMFRMLLAEDGTFMQDNFRTLQPLNNRQVYRTWVD